MFSLPKYWITGITVTLLFEHSEGILCTPARLYQTPIDHVLNRLIVGGGKELRQAWGDSLSHFRVTQKKKKMMPAIVGKNHKSVKTTKERSACDTPFHHLLRDDHRASHFHPHVTSNPLTPR